MLTKELITLLSIADADLTDDQRARIAELVAMGITNKENAPKIEKIQGEVLIINDQDDYYRVEVQDLDDDVVVVNIPSAFWKRARLASWLKEDSAITVKQEVRLKGVTTYTDREGNIKLHNGMTNEKSVVFAGITRISNRKWKELLDDMNRDAVQVMVDDLGAEKALTVEQILAMRR